MCGFVPGFGRLTDSLGVPGLRWLERRGQIQCRNARTPALPPGLFIASIVAWVLILAVGTTSARAEQLILQGSTTFNRQIVEPFQSAIESDSKHELTVIP